MNNPEALQQVTDLVFLLLPFLIPLMILELTLMIVALIHIVRHPKYRVGTQAIWVLVVIFFQIIGPIIYFIVGRGEE